MASIFELEKPAFGRSSTGKALVTAANVAVVLTAAESVGAIVVHTPTANQTVTTPIGSSIIAELGSQAQVGQTFDVTVVNLGGASFTSTFTAGASGVTVTGGGIVAHGTSVTFIGRVTNVTAGSESVIYYRS
jgi:hypothetical protein